MLNYLNQTSQESLNKVGEKFASEFTKLQNDKKSGSASALKVAKELLAFTRALEMSKSLTRSLTDNNRSIADRQTLTKEILGSVEAQQLSIDIVCDIVVLRWSKPADLQTAILEFIFSAAVVSVMARGDGSKSQQELEEIEAQLFQFREILIDKSIGSQELVHLREILSNEKHSVSGRFAIIDQLIGEESGQTGINPITILLAKYGTMSLRGKRYIVSLQQIIEKLANVRGHIVVKVTAAKELTNEQIGDLEAVLNDVYQQKIQLNIVVDPNVLGGLKIEEGAEIFDCTLLSSFNRLKQEFEYSA
jgi:F-type H+-transporting ATPase subunit delta